MKLTEVKGLEVYINPAYIQFITPSLYRKGFKTFQCTLVSMSNGWNLKVQEDFIVVLDRYYRAIDRAVIVDSLYFKELRHDGKGRKEI